MNLMKLHILVLIEQYKKVTEVARELSLKQPTVTFHMKSLEEELGVTLYLSRGGRTVLSEAGKAIYPYAQQMLSLYRDTLRTARQYKELTADKLTFSLGTESLYGQLVLSGLQKVQEEPGSLSITLQTGLPTELAGQFAERKLDALLVDQELAGQLEGTFEVLFEDELVVICGAEHAWASRQAITVEQLHNAAWIHYDSALLARVQQEAKGTFQLLLPAALEVPTYESALQAVERGMGVALATRRSADLYNQNKQKIAVLSLPGALQLSSRVMGLSYQTGTKQTGFAEKLAEAIRRAEREAN